jgi:hypothetical protein
VVQLLATSIRVYNENLALRTALEQAAYDHAWDHEMALSGRRQETSVLEVRFPSTAVPVARAIALVTRDAVTPQVDSMKGHAHGMKHCHSALKSCTRMQ